MKKLLLILFAAMAVGASAQTKDATVFGYKGKVKAATVSADNGSERLSFRFDDDGNIVGTFSDFDRVNRSAIEHQLTNRTRNSITGQTASSRNFTTTIANNRITKIVYRGSNDYSLTRTFTYNTNGMLSKIEDVEIWYTTETVWNSGYGDVEGIANSMVNDAQRNADQLSSDAQQNYDQMYADLARNPLDIQGAANRAAERNMAAANRAAERNMAAANRAANRISNAASRMGPRERKVKHTERATTTFSNYQYDDFGNWTSRTVTEISGTSVEHQTIEYDKEFWSKFYWDRLQPTGDLRRIEAFATSEKCSDNYRRLASDFWNERILAEVARVDNNSLDSLCHVSQSPIISDANRETALNIVRQSIWQNRVLPERNYQRVAEMKDFTLRRTRVFNNVYRNRIDSLSNKLRADSIQFLTNKAQEEFNANRLAEAQATARGIMKIDSKNAFAGNMAQETSFLMLQAKEQAGSIVERDYVEFLNSYPNSPHSQEVQNNRALLASSLFTRETDMDELNRVRNLPADASTAKTVNKRYRRCMFRKNRGNFFHFGFGGEFAAGPVNTIAAGGVGVRLGYTANIVNFVAGAKFNYMTYTPKMFKKPEEAGQAFFERSFISVPLMLHFNVKHGYTGATYIGVGAELNVGKVDAKLRDVENLKDNNFAQTGTTVSPRLSLGGRIFGCEIEIFGTYDTKNPFNVDYINGAMLPSGQPVQSACDADAFDKQVNRDGFFDKVRGGLALRFWL